jgi:hypothetical protein
MAKRIFISFDYDHDRQYRYLLSALSANRSIGLEFDDYTPGEIQSSDIPRVKAVLTTKIRQATHTLVVIGQYANSYHADRLEIGTRNWQWWEIEKSDEENNKFIAVKITSTNDSPDPILGKNASWANTYSVPSIITAIDGA